MSLIRHAVLVVEDEPAVLKLLQLVLSHHGFDVLLASGGEEALELYRQHRGKVSLVLMDVQMPGLDGPKTLDALKQINAEVRCCFMSGHTGKYTEADLLERGLALIDKPFTLEQLAQTIRGLVGG